MVSVVEEEEVSVIEVVTSSVIEYEYELEEDAVTVSQVVFDSDDDESPVRLAEAAMDDERSMLVVVEPLPAHVTVEVLEPLALLKGVSLVDEVGMVNIVSLLLSDVASLTTNEALLEVPTVTE